MYGHLVLRRVARFGLAFVFMAVATRVAGQTPADEARQQHAGHVITEGGAIPATRDGSGTSWLPDDTPMYAVHAMAKGWMLMGHGNGFLQFLKDGGDRGHDQFGSINWVMGMAQRNVGGGRLGLRGMLSVEPATIRGCGYPDLLATGERCNGEPIRDQQHQHDLFMEVAATYDRSLAGGIRWQVYGGPAAEPALGPVAYPHRLSAMPNLLAPITHHWLDATHITFGVITAGVYDTRWKAEASVFNGREPDEDRTGFDLAPLDSASGRVWFLPTSNLALQVAAGRLTDAEPREDGASPVDVTRLTASATYHRRLGENGIWASTAAWGRNAEGGHATDALLLETSVTLEDRDAWYGRLEVVGKSAHDLEVPGDETFTVGKLQGGYTRYLQGWQGWKPGVGVSASAGFVPSTLESTYGSRVNLGFGLFATLRPAAMRRTSAPSPGARAPGSPAGAPTHDHAPTTAEPRSSAPARRTPEAPAATAPTPTGDPKLPVMPAERVIDPACAATMNLTTAPRATYQGKVYYFCSSNDRDDFVKDPQAYMRKRGQ
jgi:YHS domain-containing protein